MPQVSDKSNSRRSRSFGGCGTCRRRHVKCDQVRPVCLTCKAIGATCEGFTAEIRWMTSSKDGNDRLREPPTPAPGTSRRHLYSGMFTESDREKMSTSMAASFPVGTIDSSLIEIDTKSKEASAAEEDICVGPFGVLNFNRAAVGSVAETQDDPMMSIDQQPAQEPVLEHVTPITMDSWTGLDDTLQWADLFGFGADSIFPPAENTLDPLLDFNTGGSLFIDPRALSGNDQAASHAYNALAGAGTRLTPADASAMTTADVLREAQMLLRHFKDTVVDRLVSLPVTSKSPWEIIILREAINTLGHLTYLESETVTCAKKAILFGMLAISAYHLCKNPAANGLGPSSQDLEQLVDTASSEAKQNLQQSLKKELHGPSKAKYKDQLMAIQCLLALAVVMGYQKDARCYLIDAERLMRHRGLAKREVSRKSRLLHHMYTWSRILGESTYVLHEYSSTPASGSNLAGTSAPNQTHVVHPSGPGSRLDDFLRLEPHHADSELDIEEVKEPQTSLRDIHLEDARDNPNTMYTEIYGITETWLSLLSQTTRLANRLDGMKATKTTDSALSDLLLRRASRLEDMICGFAADFSPRSTTPKWEPNNHMHTALNSALVIFFYRRIKNVNSFVLQSHVDDVISALERFDEAIQDKPGQGPGTPWPAFIAAAEASTQSRRKRLLVWIENGEATTGFARYSSSKELLLETWKRRDDGAAGPATGTRKSARRSGASQSTTSWLDVCREQKRWLMAF